MHACTMVNFKLHCTKKHYGEEIELKESTNSRDGITVKLMALLRVVALGAGFRGVNLF